MLMNIPSSVSSKIDFPMPFFRSSTILIRVVKYTEIPRESASIGRPTARCCAEPALYPKMVSKIQINFLIRG